MKESISEIEDFSSYVEIEGSRKIAPDAVQQPEIEKTQPLTVSLLLRSKTALPDLTNEHANRKFKRLTRQRLWSSHGPVHDDIKKIMSFAHHFDLTVVGQPKNRIVELRGSVRQMEDAFEVKLAQYASSDGGSFIGRDGPIAVPHFLRDIVCGVFGLDSRPLATPKFRINPRKETANIQYYPNQLADIYSFPNATGNGQVIALIELGGGFKSADVHSYFKKLGITPPKVVAISVDGAHNNPTTPDSADAEVMLDIEVAGAIAPRATIVVYFAPNTDKGFLDAIAAAVHDTKYKPDIISISWGAPESEWTTQSLKAFSSLFQEAAAVGITVCAAAGDRGSSDGVSDGMAHVDFPASSPYVLACGGTSLIANGNSIESETVWHNAPDSATGGGISDVFEIPAYQMKTNLPKSVNSNKSGRGVPDVAAVADPQTGYIILVDGEDLVIGGTSAVSPLMSGLIARINEKKKMNVGLIHTSIYGNAKPFRDITLGDNITAPENKGYTAGKGWDACTGNGVPVGSKLLQII
ncbi:kumamolisin [Cytophagales bacterium WSM2-2]|nr:kumamolisin [Cytophagales bacterium WSM2-2]